MDNNVRWDMFVGNAYVDTFSAPDHASALKEAKARRGIYGDLLTVRPQSKDGNQLLHRSGGIGARTGVRPLVAG